MLALLGVVSGCAAVAGGAAAPIERMESEVVGG
jgi:hypothetical protein